MLFQQAMDKVKPILNQSLGGTCSFGFVGDKFHKAFHGQACHYNVRDADARTEYYYSTVTPQPNEKDFENIYDFVLWALSDDGPWKSIVANKDRAIVVDKGAVTGFLLEVSGDTNAAMLRNLCMALRLTGEHTPHFEAYLRFKATGLSEADSFYIANSFVNKSDTVILGSPYNSNHVIVPVPMDFHLTRFTEGRPYEIGKSLDGKSGGQDGERYSGRTTPVFRQSEAVTGVKPLNELLASKETINSRWAKVERGISFDKAARIYMDDFKPKFISKLAA